MALIIAALIIFGFALIVAESFLPGGIMGIAGSLAIAAGVFLGYVNFGAATGNGLLVSVVVAAVVFTIWWLRHVPTSRAGRHWTLEATSAPGAGLPTLPVLTGERGEAITDLHPVGVARFGLHRVTVTGQGEFIAAGSAVEIIHLEGTRVVVRAS